jgi:hypothetical protein
VILSTGIAITSPQGSQAKLFTSASPRDFSEPIWRIATPHFLQAGISVRTGNDDFSQPVVAANHALEHHGIAPADLTNAARFAKFGTAALTGALLPDGLLIFRFLRNDS